MDLVRKTGFNIFASQGDQNAIMQRTTMNVINRKIDQDIITELNTATNDTGPATTASLRLALQAKTILGRNKVPFDGNICNGASASAEVSGKPVESGATAWADKQGYYRWLGVNWIVHPELPGAGTVAEKCFMYHKNAIGHAVDVSGMSTMVGYDEEQDYSFARASVFMGSKLLQNSGVVVINHDGTGFPAS